MLWSHRSFIVLISRIRVGTCQATRAKFPEVPKGSRRWLSTKTASSPFQSRREQFPLESCTAGLAFKTRHYTSQSSGRMAKAKVLLLGKIDQFIQYKELTEFVSSAQSQKDWESLSEHAETVIPRAKNREEFLEECKSGKLDGVVASYRTFDSTEVTGLMDAELIKALPESLKFICHNGAGYDQIDISACSERKLYVSNTPTAVDDSTADTAVFLILGTLRKLNGPMAALRRGQFRGEKLPPLGNDPQGKTLGILGMGGIGKNMANKMRAFDMKVIYHNRTRLSEAEAEGAEYVGFDELLQKSDVLSLNLPLNPNTRHIIGKPQFEKMKRGIHIVNTARGAVMDEAALVDALNEGLVESVGLDVYEDEPKVHPGLVANERVTLLPHLGTWTIETQEKMECWTISNLKQAITDGTLRSRVPEQKNMDWD